MRPTTDTVICKISELFTQLTFDEAFEKRMPVALRSKMIDANVESFARHLATYDPIKQGYIEAIFADPMAWEALVMVCMVCYNTRRSLENIIVSKVLEQSALDELAHATPKGHA